MAVRRKAVPRPRGVEVEEPWPSPWTVEGRVEAVGRIARIARDDPHRRGRAARVFMWTWLLVLSGGLVATVVSMLVSR